METKKRPRGRPEGKNFEFIKSIKLNQKQVNNWDSKRIKNFLEGKLEIDTEILKKLLVKFIDLEVKLEDTTEIEDKRIMELIEECQLI